MRETLLAQMAAALAKGNAAVGQMCRFLGTDPSPPMASSSVTATSSRASRALQ